MKSFDLLVEEILEPILYATLELARKEMFKTTDMAMAEAMAFATCPKDTSPECPKKAPAKKMGKPMRRYHYDEDYCEDDFCGCDKRQDQKQVYLSGRLYQVTDILETKLREQFNLVEMPPKTVEELIEKITKGQYTLPSEDYRKDRAYWRPIDLIEWRDPAKPKDQAGFDVAYQAMRDAKQKIEDAIAILTPEAALEAIVAFEGWTYTAK